MWAPLGGFDATPGRTISLQNCGSVAAYVVIAMGMLAHEILSALAAMPRPAADHRQIGRRCIQATVHSLSPEFAEKFTSDGELVPALIEMC